MAEKLHRQHSVTGCVSVFIHTNPFAVQEPQYQRAATVKLDAATKDTRTIIRLALSSLKAIYKPRFGYQKCGVQLSAIRPAASPSQVDLSTLAARVCHPITPYSCKPWTPSIDDFLKPSRLRYRASIKAGNQKLNAFHNAIPPLARIGHRSLTQ